ncbi:hypothetical protein Ddye_025029 [Dipteronia dyeriana]|uniref:Uncharacterized protein n=1 Tax=Dipteronia dyeriana TaxID=168575 RepID=A0AAD9TWH2_9ROSI|nr:hypothetical protein Ddye_025029 [Dipteronia dyeriana]
METKSTNQNFTNLVNNYILSYSNWNSKQLGNSSSSDNGPSSWAQFQNPSRILSSHKLDLQIHLFLTKRPIASSHLAETHWLVPNDTPTSRDWLRVELDQHGCVSPG